MRGSMAGTGMNPRIQPSTSRSGTMTDHRDPGASSVTFITLPYLGIQVRSEVRYS
jgi:hypothetical protein